jgi:hypothetical protein
LNDEQGRYFQPRRQVLALRWLQRLAQRLLPQQRALLLD